MHDHMRKVRRGLMLATALLLMGVLAGPAWAVDGVIEINQARALKGGVTTGDEPGFPVTITQGGSYRLTGNLTVPDASTTAILIRASHVTIDLNGFAIIGPGGSANGAGRGIDAAELFFVPCVPEPDGCETGTDTFVEFSPYINSIVVNGTVNGVGSHGIYIGASARVEKVHATNNGVDGIQVGDRSVVAGNTAHGNHGCGIVAHVSTVTGNTTASNGGCGIRASWATVSGNTVVGNSGWGMEASGTGYAQNVLAYNHRGNDYPQVTGGIQMGPNVCGTALCP